MARLRQIELLYQELKTEILKDVDIMILRAGGNYQTAAQKSGIHIKSFYIYMSGKCSMHNAVMVHKKVSEAVARGEKFGRQKQGNTFSRYNATSGRKKKVENEEQTNGQNSSI